MKITILCENQAGHDNARVCLAEWGFSAFIEVHGVSILLDSGHTDVYMKNALNLGINLENTDFAVLSHHHWDHIGGFTRNNFPSGKRLIMHPDVKDKIAPEDAKKLEADFLITESSVPLEIAKNIFFLGEIPRTNSFETGTHKGAVMTDDSAIAVKTDKGAIVITGCSHSGICNICEYAKRVTGQNLYAVIGGFHLFSENMEVVESTVSYFKEEKIPQLYPMHCLDLPVLTRFYSEFGIKKLCAGDSLELQL